MGSLLSKEFCPRILAFGGSNIGKTYAAVKVVERILEDADFGKYDGGRIPKVWYADFDEGLSPVLREFSDAVMEHLQPTYFMTFDYDEFKKFFDEVHEKGRPGDWIILDMLDMAWELTQSYYVSNIYDADPGAYWMTMKKQLQNDSKAKDKAPKLQGWQDYVTIKKLHNADIMDRLKFKRDYNQLWLTGQKDFDFSNAKLEKDAEIKSMFLPLKKKPGGEKHNIHRVHTILHLTFDGKRYYVQAIKNRGRKLFGRTEIKKNQSLLDVWTEYS